MNYTLKNQEQDYYSPHPPESWPIDNSITIKNVTFKHSGFTVKSLDNLDLEMQPNEKSAVYENVSGTGITALFLLLCKLARPDKSTGSPSISIGGVSLDKIGRKCTS